MRGYHCIHALLNG